MSIDLERTAADYEARLLERVWKWEEKNHDAADVLRCVVQTRMGMPDLPPIGSIRWLSLEQMFREEVRKQQGWPSAAEWIKGA